MKAKTETPATYQVNRTEAQAEADKILQQAAVILAAIARRSGDAMSSPEVVKRWLQCEIANREHEVFVVVFLDSQNRILGHEELFRGTLTQTSVYPREVVKAALAANAGGVLFAHNHPSGLATPSSADKFLTKTLKEALGLVDVRVLDHFVVTAGSVTSFAETGLL